MWMDNVLYSSLFIVHSSFSIIIALTVCEDSGVFLFKKKSLTKCLFRCKDFSTFADSIIPKP